MSTEEEERRSKGPSLIIPINYDVVSTDTQDVPTQTTFDQIECEESCRMYFIPLERLPEDQIEDLQEAGLINSSHEVRLLREKHVNYLRRGLDYLAPSYAVLDASRPWVIYWMIHGLELLNEEPYDHYPRCIETIKRFWHLDGGFGGGPQQIGHMATTYASCLALAIIGKPEAYNAVDRAALYRFFMKRKDPITGAFHAHDGGETDVRMSYCVLAVASLYGILTKELAENVAEYTLSCQTYEGGFGGEPDNEAHGGYAFCAVASLVLLGRLQDCDVENLKLWIRNRQTKLEGGYQGRTNKLVDGCYSFWQGSIPTMISRYFTQLHFEDNKMNTFETFEYSTLCDPLRLQQYILLCGQQVEGGLRDKPGKPRDYYHTAYCLSGLSVSQHGDLGSQPEVFGDQRNLLVSTHPVYNIGMDKVLKIQEYWTGFPLSHSEMMSGSE